MASFQEKIMLYVLTCLLNIIISIIISLSLTAQCYAKKTVIATPSFFHKVVEINGNKVYLKRFQTGCGAIGIKTDEGRAEIDIDDSINSVEIYDDGKFWRKQDIKPFDINAVLEVSKYTGDINNIINKGIIETGNKYADEGMRAAETLVKEYNSKTFRNKLEREKERLAREVFKSSYGNMTVKTADKEKRNKETDRTGEVYLFVSKSVPIETLRNYAKSVSGMNTDVAIVLRGFVGGVEKIKPTMNFIADIIKQNPECDFTNGKCPVYDVDIRIDPKLFEKYCIEEIPAVVYDNGNRDYSKVYGDMSLEYLLTKINSDKIFKDGACKSH